MIDLRDHHSEKPRLVVTGWRARERKKILGKMGEEGERDMEESTLTRGPRCVSESTHRVRWASPICQETGKTSCPASIAQCSAVSSGGMDSSVGQRVKVEELHNVGELEQSSEESQEGGLTLEDLLRLKNIFEERLKDLEET